MFWLFIWNGLVVTTDWCLDSRVPPWDAAGIDQSTREESRGETGVSREGGH